MNNYDYAQSACNSAGIFQAQVQSLRPKDGLHGVYEQYQGILRQLDISAEMAACLADRLGGQLSEATDKDACSGPRSSGVLGQLEDIAGSLRSRLADIERAHARINKMIGE